MRPSWAIAEPNELFEYLIYYNNHRPPSGPRRANAKGLRRCQNPNHSISELVNIDNCDILLRKPYSMAAMANTLKSVLAA
jgi:hypothetical protein